MKAQASVEYLLVTGIALLVLSTVIIGAFSYLDSLKKTVALQYADAFISGVCGGVDEVSQYSAGSSMAQSLYFPDGIFSNKSYIQGNFINLNIQGSDINGKCAKPITGKLPSQGGFYKVHMTNRGDTVELSFE